MKHSVGASPTSALWLLLAHRPDVLANHGMAYAMLVEEQTTLHLERGKRVVVRQLLMLLCMGVAFVCGAVALMLLAISPAQPLTVLALFAALVLLPAITALWLWLAAPVARIPSLVGMLQEQLKVDWELFHGHTPVQMSGQTHGHTP